MEKIYPKFDEALLIGEYNQKVIAHEFAYQGVPLTETSGEHPFDFYLPNGKSLEWKLDLRSQCTMRGLIEDRTMERRPDYAGFSFTVARVFPLVLLDEIYRQAKPVKDFGSVGGYTGRAYPQMALEGVRLRDFIQTLKDTRKAA